MLQVRRCNTPDANCTGSPIGRHNHIMRKKNAKSRKNVRTIVLCRVVYGESIDYTNGTRAARPTAHHSASLEGSTYIAVSTAHASPTTRKNAQRTPAHDRTGRPDARDPRTRREPTRAPGPHRADSRRVAVARPIARSNTETETPPCATDATRDRRDAAAPSDHRATRRGCEQTKYNTTAHRTRMHRV